MFRCPARPASEWCSTHHLDLPVSASNASMKPPPWPLPLMMIRPLAANGIGPWKRLPGCDGRASHMRIAGAAIERHQRRILRDHVDHVAVDADAALPSDARRLAAMLPRSAGPSPHRARARGCTGRHTSRPCRQSAAPRDLSRRSDEKSISPAGADVRGVDLLQQRVPLRVVRARVQQESFGSGFNRSLSVTWAARPAPSSRSSEAVRMWRICLRILWRNGPFELSQIVAHWNRAKCSNSAGNRLVAQDFSPAHCQARATMSCSMISSTVRRWSRRSSLTVARRRGHDRQLEARHEHDVLTAETPRVIRLAARHVAHPPAVAVLAAADARAAARLEGLFDECLRQDLPPVRPARR